MSLVSPEGQDVKIDCCRLKFKLQGKRICSYWGPLNGKSYLPSKAEAACQQAYRRITQQRSCHGPANLNCSPHPQVSQETCPSDCWPVLV